MCKLNRIKRLGKIRRPILSRLSMRCFDEDKLLWVFFERLGFKAIKIIAVVSKIQTLNLCFPFKSSKSTCSFISYTKALASERIGAQLKLFWVLYIFLELLYSVNSTCVLLRLSFHKLDRQPSQSICLGMACSRRKMGLS